MNYRIWSTDSSEQIIVEVFNKNDVPNVQKEFIEKGYVVTQTEYHVFGCHLIKFSKVDNYEGLEQ